MQSGFVKFHDEPGAMQNFNVLSFDNGPKDARELFSGMPSRGCSVLTAPRALLRYVKLQIFIVDRPESASRVCQAADFYR